MLIRDTALLNPEFQVEEHRDVLVEEGRFFRISAAGSLEVPCEKEIVNGRNCLLMPGFYNTHCHVPMTLLRGLGEGLCLSDWLTKKMFPFEERLTAEDCRFGALLGCMELMASGCVSFSDMYFHIQSVAEAAEEAGMKANISHGLSLRDEERSPKELKGWRDTLELIEWTKGRQDGRIQAEVGLHAEYTSTERLVREAAGLAKERGLRLHTHISETKKEHEECKLCRQGRTPVQYYRDCGIFDVPVVGAHGVWLEDEDMEILREAGATLSHCISSNLKLGSGIAPVSRWLDRGINTVIATDGAASNNNLNLMEEMHLASLAGKGAFGNPQLLSPEQILKMATINGARAQGRLDCGCIKEGNRADFILVDLDRPHLIPRHSLLANLVYSAQSSDIRMTAVDGKVVYKDGEFLTIDRERVMYEAERRAERICGQLSER